MKLKNIQGKPLVSTPAVADRVVIQASLDDTLPATFIDSSSNITPPLSSSPRGPVHSSPDHGHLASRAAPPPTPSLSFTLDDIVSARIPILHYYPKTARRELASLKTAIWRDVSLNLDDETKWLKAFAYTKLVLFVPPGKKNFKEKASTVKSWITAFREGRLDDLWRQATRQPSRRGATSSSSASINIRRATTLAQEGQYSKAAKALTSQGLDFDFPEVQRNMTLLHPPSPAPPPLPAPPATPYFSSADVLSALHSFHSLSAGGPSASHAPTSAMPYPPIVATNLSPP